VRLGGGVREVTPVAGDDLPVFDETPLRAVAFEPRALPSPGRRGPLVAGAWAMAMIAIVGIGLFAGEPEGADRPGDGLANADGAGPAEPRPADLDLPSTFMGARLLGDVIELHAPEHREEVTTSAVVVRGSMVVRADRVRIALKARGDHLLESVWIDVFDPDGGVRPSSKPTFEAAFDLPLPRPNGTMWIVVTTYDERGMPLGSTRRPFIAGPLETSAFVRPDDKGLDGNWPWRPYSDPSPAAAPLPTCLPVSSTLASSC
jgi:hypothetical protein